MKKSTLAFSPRNLAAFLVALSLTLVGCGATLNAVMESSLTEIGVQRSIAYVIRDDNGVTSEDVLDTVARIRPRLTAEVRTVDQIVVILDETVNLDGMLPEDQIVIRGLINGTLEYLESRGALPEDLRGDALTVLEWAEFAAILVGPTDPAPE